MRIVGCVISILLLGACACDQPPNASQSSARMVQNLYREALARPNAGIPKGADLVAFAPYLAPALLHRFDLASACAADWHRQNPGFSLKPEYGWLEMRPFSGSDNGERISAFAVEKAQPEEDGATRVYVRLTYKDLDDSQWRRHVVVVVRDEKVEDVFFVVHPNGSAEHPLSQVLSSGCDGSRWVGRNSPTP